MFVVLECVEFIFVSIRNALRIYYKLSLTYEYYNIPKKKKTEQNEKTCKMKVKEKRRKPQEF